MSHTHLRRRNPPRLVACQAISSPSSSLFFDRLGFSGGCPVQAGRPLSKNSLWVIPQTTQALVLKSKRCPRTVRSSGICPARINLPLTQQLRQFGNVTRTLPAEVAVRPADESVREQYASLGRVWLDCAARAALQSNALTVVAIKTREKIAWPRSEKARPASLSTEKERGASPACLAGPTPYTTRAHHSGQLISS